MTARRRTAGFVLAGLLLSLLLAGVVSGYASSAPDGLDSASTRGCTVAADGTVTGGSCLARGAQDHELATGPLADYGVRGIGAARLSTGLAGVTGVLLTFALAGGLFWLTRRRGVAADGRPDPQQPSDPESGADPQPGSRVGRESAAGPAPAQR